MKSTFVSLTTIITALLVASTATTQEEFPPPSGKGRVVVVAADASGKPPFREVARLRAGRRGFQAKPYAEAFARTEATLRKALD